MTAELTPRVYVACLAAYNNGHLHGRWIDANQDADTIREEVAEMLKASPIPQAEEWAIHDYEDFGGIKLSESEGFEEVARLAELLEKHGKAFAAYAGYIGGEATEGGFEEAYHGHHSSEQAYVEELVSELYSEKELGPLANYIDYESYARDLFMGDYTSVDGDGGVYVFSNI